MLSAALKRALNTPAFVAADFVPTQWDSAELATPMGMAATRIPQAIMKPANMVPGYLYFEAAPVKLTGTRAKALADGDGKVRLRRPAKRGSQRGLFHAPAPAAKASKTGAGASDDAPAAELKVRPSNSQPRARGPVSRRKYRLGNSRA
jgi:hypothetical protein